MKNLALKSLLLTSTLFVGAFALTDSAITQRNSLLQNIREMDFSNPGVLFTGEMYGGANVSNAELNSNKTAENQAYTEAKFILQARPTAESYAQVQFRAHKDWQKAYEEGFNPVLFDWWSYNGKFVNDKSNFAIGDMRVHYSPLTIATPTLDIIQEAEIFTQRRERAMDYRHLDNSNRRLMQGVNFELNSGKVSAFDNLFWQGTISRLRNQAKKHDQYFYDFHSADRYLVATRAGLDLFGVGLAANVVYSFNRDRSAENFLNGMLNVDEVLLENNLVTSGELSYSFINSNTLNLSLNSEFAWSNYKTNLLFRDYEFNDVLVMETIKREQVGEDLTLHAIVNKRVRQRTLNFKDMDNYNGKAFNVNLDLSAVQKNFETESKLSYIQNHQRFESEMALSPVYLNPITVLNSKGLNQMGVALGQMRGNLESMYNYIYQTQPLNRHTLVSGDNPAPDNQLMNNFKMDHFTRNAYTNVPLTRAERMELGEIDPGMDIALPYGVGTPDRRGAVLTSDLLFLNNKALEANVRFSFLQAPKADQNYLTAGLGLGFDLGALLGWKQQLKLSGAFEMTDETKGSERKGQRIAFGIDEKGFGASRLSVHAGFQRMTKEGKLPFINVEDGSISTINYKTVEDFVLVGPAFELARGTKLIAQYGLLTQSINGIADLKINRHIAMGEIQMKF